MQQGYCIVTEGLSVVYRKGGKRAVNGLDLKVPERTVFGILGPNGAGKTSLLSVLCGVRRPSEGRVCVLDHELPAEKEALKARIGVVPQEIALHHSLSVRENLNYLGKMHSIPREILRERVEDLLGAFRLEEKADERVARLSGGMKRRVNLMAGLLHRPELLFLDEPTTGIDVHSKGMILDHLKKEKEGGMAILYTSHDLEEAQELCERIAVMDEGRIVKEAGAEELVGDVPLTGDSLRKLLMSLTAAGAENPAT